MRGSTIIRALRRRTEEVVITQKKQVYGIDEQRDLQAALISREARPLRVRFREGVWQNARIVIVLTALYIGICPWFYVLPNLVEVLSVFLIGFTLYARGLRPKPFFRVPLKDTKKGDEEDAGIIYFGSDPKRRPRGVVFRQRSQNALRGVRDHGFRKNHVPPLYVLSGPAHRQRGDLR